MKRWLPWIGWLFSLAAVSILLMSARWKLTFDPWYVKEWGRIGWDPRHAAAHRDLQSLSCVVLYLTPAGGARRGAARASRRRDLAVTRLEEPYPVLVPLSVALFAWAGLYLREERLRSLLPFRRTP